MYNSNVNSGTVSYKKHEDTNWILNGTNMSFTVSKPGLYDIKFTDKAGNESIVTEYFYVENGMVLHLDGENNTKNGHNANATIWEDLSENGNDATLINFTNNSDESGWQNDSLVFDGTNDYAQIKDPQNIPVGSTPYTIEVIFKSKQSNMDGGLFNIGIKNESGKSNAIRIMNGTGFKHPYWGNDLVTAQGILEVGKKYNVMAVNYGSDRRIYLNTNLKAQDSATPNTTLGEVTIGLVNKELNQYFDSNIYEVRLYNRGLTEEEMKINFKIDQYRFNIE